MDINEYMQVIKKVQTTQRNILKEFDSFCRGHNLKYSLAFGTLLGAVRHQGFIPWDDDIDVYMLREDYEKFLELRNQFNSEYYVQNYLIDESNFPFTKVRKNNTKMVMKSAENDTYHQGVWIDIFPLDSIPKNMEQAAKISDKSALLLAVVTSNSFSKVKAAGSFVNKSLRFMFYLGNMIFGKQFFIRKYERLLKTQYDSDKLYCLTDSVYGKFYNAPVLSRMHFEDMKYLDFEGLPCMVMNHYEAYLKGQYGDYMQYPPKEQQYPHHVIVELEL